MSSNVLFCSDLHLGHELAAEKRGYRSVALHDIAVVKKLAEQCDKRTVLYVLGDVAMQLDSLYMLAGVKGRKKLVRGNHDKFQMSHYLRLFEEILGCVSYKHMWLSHFPMHPQELFGRINVHGHIHQFARSELLDWPYFNVNWDYWHRALNLDEIVGSGPRVVYERQVV